MHMQLNINAGWCLGNHMQFNGQKYVGYDVLKYKN